MRVLKPWWLIGLRDADIDGDVYYRRIFTWIGSGSWTNTLSAAMVAISGSAEDAAKFCERPNSSILSRRRHQTRSALQRGRLVSASIGQRSSWSSAVNSFLGKDGRLTEPSLKCAMLFYRGVAGRLLLRLSMRDRGTEARRITQGRRSPRCRGDSRMRSITVAGKVSNNWFTLRLLAG